jgi:hypothetical protein
MLHRLLPWSIGYLFFQRDHLRKLGERERGEKLERDQRRVGQKSNKEISQILKNNNKYNDVLNYEVLKANVSIYYEVKQKIKKKVPSKYT